MRRIALVAFLSLLPTLAHADDDAERRARCGASYEGGQRSRSDGRLLRARDELRTCARDCSPAFAKQCVDWLQEVEREVPSIVPSVEGSDRSDVRVAVDGTFVRETIDGRPIELDPGPHKIRFVTADGKSSAERDVVVKIGVRLEPVKIPISTALVASKPVSVSPRRPFPVAAGVFAALAVVSVGVGTGLFVSGRVMESDLAASGCAPYCDPSRVEPIDLRYQIGAGAFALGGVALVATLVTWALRPTRGME